MIATSLNKLPTQDTFSLQKVWQTVDFSSCPDVYNFHMHTTCSDGQLAPLDLIEQALTIGLKGLAITDHHSVNGFLQARQYLSTIRQAKPLVNLPHLWTGVEITAKLMGVDVHILGYGFDPTHPSLTTYLQGSSPEGKNAVAKRVVDCLHQAGGLVVLAHPFRYRHSAKKLIPLAVDCGVDGVEAYYAYGNPQPWKPSSKQTTEALQLAAKYNLYTTCGTDTHGLNLLRRI
ncbi:MAG: PHP domain-containing protein [Pleurocapsa sp.]